MICNANFSPLYYTQTQNNASIPRWNQNSQAAPMISFIRVSIALFGDSFSPRKASELTGIHFTELHELGEIGINGRFRGRPYPFGHAVIEVPVEGEDNGPLILALESIAPHINELRTLGMTYGKCLITYGYDDQCNLSFSPEVLSALAKTGLELDVSCHQDTDSE